MNKHPTEDTLRHRERNLDISPELEAYRRLLLDQLAVLDRAHRDAAAPILRRLADIERCNHRPSIVLNLDVLPADQRERIEAMIKKESGL